MAAPGVRPLEIPAGWTVWAGSDLHGQRQAVDRLLAEAGLTDGGDRWTAPPGTALVVTGDVVDRGPDSVGLVRRLTALRRRAPEAEGQVAILEGNHEAQVLGGLDGVPAIFDAMLAFGGGATLRSVGLRREEWEGRDARDIRRRVDELAPDLVPSLSTFAPYARWGDVLFVHAGPVPHQDLDAFERSARRLWVREPFFAAADPFPDGEGWAAYRDAGICRVVFGHTPVDRPTLVHDGHGLNLDTWRGGIVTLARLEPGAPLSEARILSVPAEPRAVADAPLDPAEIGRLDASLPGVVDAWTASLAPTR